MKKGISLIETLISLTIVGLSLIALLPVMTVQKTSESTISGNQLFTNSNPSYTATLPFVVGNPTTAINNLPVANHNFEIYLSGLANSNVVPLRVSDIFMSSNYKMKNVGANALHISSGTVFSQMDLPNDILNIYYPMNIYLDQNNVVVTTNATVATEAFALSARVNSGGNTNYSITKNFIDTDFNQIEPAVNMIAGANRLTSISNDSGEFFHIFNTNYSGVNFHHIGIGQNAIGHNNMRFLNHNIVAIYNNGADNEHPVEQSPNADLAIGLLPYVNDGTRIPFTTDQYVISHEIGGSFHINSATFGDSSVAGAKTVTLGKLIAASDKRLKNIISDYKKGLNEILKINPVEFVFKADKEQKHHIGVIAQDLKKILPEAVHLNSDTGYYMVSDEPIFYALLNAVKELNSKYLIMKKNNDDLENKILELKKIRDNLKASTGGANE